MTNKDDRIKQLLKLALPPVDHDPAPSRDLWPAVLRRLGASAPALPASVPWFDWALLTGLIVFALTFPATIPVFLYYL